MGKRFWIQLICGIIMIGLFLISWLVFKDIKPFDLIILVLGILDFVDIILLRKKS